MKHSVCSGKNWQNKPTEVTYFQEQILWAQFLHLLISRKAVKSFIVTSGPCDRGNLQKCVLDCMYPTSPKSHIYWPFPLPLGRSFSKAVSWAIVLILPPIKLNSQLSRCDFFLSWQRQMDGPTGMAARNSLWVLENSSFPRSRQLPSMICVGRIIPKLNVSVLFVLAYTSLGEVGHYMSKVEMTFLMVGSECGEKTASLPSWRMD